MRATVHAETADGDTLLAALFLKLNEGRDAQNVWTGSAAESSVDLEAPVNLGWLDQQDPPPVYRYAFAARVVAEDLQGAAMDPEVPAFGPLSITISDE